MAKSLASESDLSPFLMRPVLDTGAGRDCRCWTRELVVIAGGQELRERLPRVWARFDWCVRWRGTLSGDEDPRHGRHRGSSSSLASGDRAALHGVSLVRAATEMAAAMHEPIAASVPVFPQNASCR